jgi:hypothetical protein
MIISQRHGGFLHPTWSMSPPMKCPRITLLGRALHCNTLEFNANVDGEGLLDVVSLEWRVYLAYSELPEKFLGNDAYSAKTTGHGEIHLRLCFQSIGNLEMIRYSMVDMKWAKEYCTKVNLFLYCEGDDTPNEESLSRAQTLAVANKDSGLKVDRYT